MRVKFVTILDLSTPANHRIRHCQIISTSKNNIGLPLRCTQLPIVDFADGEVLPKLKKKYKKGKLNLALAIKDIHSSCCQTRLQLAFQTDSRATNQFYRISCGSQIDKQKLKRQLSQSSYPLAGHRYLHARRIGRTVSLPECLTRRHRKPFRVLKARHQNPSVGLSTFSRANGQASHEGLART